MSDIPAQTYWHNLACRYFGAFENDLADAKESTRPGAVIDPSIVLAGLNIAAAGFCALMGIFDQQQRANPPGMDDRRK